MEVSQKLRETLGQGLIEHEILRTHTTMHVGGVADYYYEAKTIDELIKAVQAAVDTDIPYFVLGGW